MLEIRALSRSPSWRIEPGRLGAGVEAEQESGALESGALESAP